MWYGPFPNLLPPLCLWSQSSKNKHCKNFWYTLLYVNSGYASALIHRLYTHRHSFTVSSSVCCCYCCFVYSLLTCMSPSCSTDSIFSYIHGLISISVSYIPSSPSHLPQILSHSVLPSISLSARLPSACLESLVPCWMKLTEMESFVSFGWLCSSVIVWSEATLSAVYLHVHSE